MGDSWFNLGRPGFTFQEIFSQKREVKVSPQKYKLKETWKRSSDSPRKPVVKRAVQSLEFSPRSTVRMEVYFENINGDFCLTKVKPENLVRWKLLKKKYWPLNFHTDITSKKTVSNALYNMKNHKTIKVTLTDREAQPYKNGKYIDVPKKPKPKTEKKEKATPSKIVNNIRYETNNYYNSGPSTSNYNQIKYDDGQNESSDSEEYSNDSEEYSSDSEEYSNDYEKYPSYVKQEFRNTDVYRY